MAARRTVIIGSPSIDGRPVTLRDVQVRELAVREVRDWLAEYEAAETRGDPVRLMIWDEFGLDDLARMCDAPAVELESYTPSELENLVIACKELNPHFFRVRAAVAAVARAMTVEAGRMTSTAAAAP